VVTGASSGIGKVYADRLAKRGYDLILVARRKERLEGLSRELQQKHGVRAEVLVADLGNQNDLKRVGDAIAADERITLLVNNAGTSAVKPSIDLPVEAVHNQMDVNAKSVTHLSLAILPNFVKRNGGTLINIGSVLSFFALPISTSYSATKAHVMLFTIGLRDELANTNVRVQLVLPRAQIRRFGTFRGSASKISIRPRSCPQKIASTLPWQVWTMERPSRCLQSRTQASGPSSMRPASRWLRRHRQVSRRLGTGSASRRMYDLRASTRSRVTAVSRM
jgi:short-subunit dehydrogenase